MTQQMREHLLKELGPLNPTEREFATEILDNILEALNCSEPTPEIRDPGALSPRDRILSLLEQAAPGMLDSDAGPHVEAAVNALLMHVQSVRSESRVGTVNL